jgi:hypothetical protein
LKVTPKWYVKNSEEVKADANLVPNLIEISVGHIPEKLKLIYEFFYAVKGLFWTLRVLSHSEIPIPSFPTSNLNYVNFQNYMPFCFMCQFRPTVNFIGKVLLPRRKFALKQNKKGSHCEAPG